MGFRTPRPSGLWHSALTTILPRAKRNLQSIARYTQLFNLIRHKNPSQENLHCFRDTSELHLFWPSRQLRTSPPTERKPFTIPIPTGQCELMALLWCRLATELYRGCLQFRWLSTFHPLPKPSPTLANKRNSSGRIRERNLTGQKRTSGPRRCQPPVVASATATATALAVGSGGGNFDPTQRACANRELFPRWHSNTGIRYNYTDEDPSSGISSCSPLEVHGRFEITQSSG
jgi:hypothetical protein